MSDYHLAQINIAHGLAAKGTAQMQGFYDRIDEINALADKSPGFIWRLQDEAGDATSIQAFDDPNMLINISVWQDLQSLRMFVYRSLHKELIKQRNDWFKPSDDVYQAMWWVPVGHIPDIEEGKSKLALLNSQGPNAESFTFAQPYPAGGTDE